MLDKEFTKFTESGLSKQETFMPQYQVTKLDTDTYQIYDFSERKAELCSAKDALKKIASFRGGRPLNRDLSTKIINMGNFQTYTIADSALHITKCASASSDVEPWKLVVAADGNEYFVSASSDADEEEKNIKATAACHTKHVYSIKIHAHNIREIAKIADMAETCMNAIPGTTQIPSQEVICFDVASEESPEEVNASIQKEVEGEGIILADSGYTVDNSCCPCGCGRQVNCPCPEEKPVVEYIVPQDIPVGEFALTSPESVVISVAASAYTLKKYASSKYNTYRIYNSDHEVIAEMKDGIEIDASSKTFGDELTAFLKEQLSKKAEGAVEVIGPDGNVKNKGADIQQGDDIVNKETGEVTTVTKVDAADEAGITKQAIPSDDSADEDDYAPGEKDPKDTKAKGDEEVKTWKGMREVDGRFVVYITKSKERIFATAEEAINWMTRN